MKVLQINTVSGYGSTGGICIDLALELEKKGHECYIAYGQLTTDYSKSYKIGSIVENHIHNALSRITGKQGYFTKNGTIKLIQYIRNINPDIIHLHNLHGNYLNWKILFNYLKSQDKPVFWTLHDCNAFTGKCAHYTEVECYKWQTHCKHCPQVHGYPPSLILDRSSEMFDDKKKWFTSIKDLTLIPVSNWLAKEVKISFLGNHPIIPIYNWIDQALYKPSESDVKEKLGIPKSKFIILGVSAHWTADKSKLLDFIQLSKLITQDMQIILVGGNKKLVNLPANIIHIRYIKDKTGLAEIYSMADVYVHVSTEDTFGKVIAEAMSCGTPAIVYDSTACPELIGEGCGYIVKKRAIADIYRNICVIKTRGKLEYSYNCISHVHKNFNMKINTDQIIKLYNKA